MQTNLSYGRICTVVWVILMLLTIASYLVFEGQLDRLGVSEEAGAITLLVIAFFKVRLVIIHFMEVGHAILPLRAALEAWVALTFAMTVFFYFWSPSSVAT